MLNFVGKHLTAKIFVHFHFLFKWRGFKPTSMSDQIYRKRETEREGEEEKEKYNLT